MIYTIRLACTFLDLIDRWDRTALRGFITRHFGVADAVVSEVSGDVWIGAIGEEGSFGRWISCREMGVLINAMRAHKAA